MGVRTPKSNVCTISSQNFTGGFTISRQCVKNKNFNSCCVSYELSALGQTCGEEITPEPYSIFTKLPLSFGYSEDFNAAQQRFKSAGMLISASWLGPKLFKKLVFLCESRQGTIQTIAVWQIFSHNTAHTEPSGEKPTLLCVGLCFHSVLRFCSLLVASMPYANVDFSSNDHKRLFIIPCC